MNSPTELLHPNTLLAKSRLVEVKEPCERYSKTQMSFVTFVHTDRKKYRVVKFHASISH